MFNLKKYRHTFLSGVHGVTGVPSVADARSQADALAQGVSTSSHFEVYRGVTSKRRKNTGTHKNTFGIVESVDGIRRDIAPVMDLSVPEHLEHEEHPDKKSGHHQDDKLQRVFLYLSLQLDVAVAVLLQDYFTADDIAEIKCGVYDDKLSELAELIRSDSRFLSTAID